MKSWAESHASRSKWVSRRFRIKKCCEPSKSWEPKFRPSSVKSPPPAPRGPDALFGSRPTNNLDEPVRPNPFLEGGANLIGGDRKILLRSPHRFVERKTDLSASEQSARHAVFT